MTDEPILSDELKALYPDKRKHGRGRIGFAYKRKIGHPGWLEADIPVVLALDEAMNYLEDGVMSLRQATDWIVNKTGKMLTHQSLNKMFQEHRGAVSETLKVRAARRQLEKEKKRTREEIKMRSLTKKIAQAKTLRTKYENKVKRLENPQPGPITTTEGNSFSVNAPEGMPEEERETIFKPNPGPQTAFLAAEEKQVLYGGAAGGGKSYALLADPVRYFHNPNFNGILLRRTNDELRELIWKSQQLYPRLFPANQQPKWNEKKSSWTFPAGGNLWLTYLERDEDVLRYQGQAFSWIGFDELTQYSTPFAWNYLFSRLRSTDPELQKNLSQRATTNPGGPGHGWVKKLFIDPSPPGKRFVPRDLETEQELVYPEGHAKAGQPLYYRKFIPASLYDNPYLTEDGSYEANLLSLPEQQRRQLLDGDWNVADGAAFSEFRVKTHVIEGFEIPNDWRKFRSCDFGYSSHSAVHWYAIDPADETLYVYRELYVSKKTARDLAKMILELEKNEQIAYGVLDSSCWHTRGNTGPTIAEEMILEGCRWRPSDRTAGARISSKNRLHELLKTKSDAFGNEKPGILFFDSCRQIISDLPVIPSDPKGTDDIDVRYSSDHAYDSIRYGIQSRPRSGSPLDWGSKPMNFYTPVDSTFGY